MKSLILKDVISLKGYFKTLVIIIGFFTVTSFSYEDPSFLSGMIILTMSMLPLTTFSYDQQAKWDLFSQTLPVSRKQLVLSKYVLGIIAVVGGALVAIFLNLIVALVKSISMDFLYLIQSVSLIALVALLFLSILMPLIYKFGVEKSRMITIMVLAIPAVFVYGLSKVGLTFPNLDDIAPNVLFISGLVCVICIILVSYILSVRIYLKRDF